MKNNRPISNLPFINLQSLEKVEARRINQHWEHNNLNKSYQSAYRKGHSTETLFLKVHSDTAEALDEGTMTALIMLDLSAAFDVIDYPILLNVYNFPLTSKKRL